MVALPEKKKKTKRKRDLQNDYFWFYTPYWVIPALYNASAQEIEKMQHLCMPQIPGEESPRRAYLLYPLLCTHTLYMNPEIAQLCRIIPAELSEKRTELLNINVPLVAQGDITVDMANSAMCDSLVLQVQREEEGRMVKRLLKVWYQKSVSPKAVVDGLYEMKTLTFRTMKRPKELQWQVVSSPEGLPPRRYY